MYYKKGLFARAIEAFDQALARAPDRAIYHYHLGLARVNVNQIDEGRAALRRSLTLGLSGSDRDTAVAVLNANCAAAERRD